MPCSCCSGAYCTTVCILMEVSSKFHSPAGPVVNMWEGTFQQPSCSCPDRPVKGRGPTIAVRFQGPLLQRDWYLRVFKSCVEVLRALGCKPLQPTSAVALLQVSTPRNAYSINSSPAQSTSSTLNARRPALGFGLLVYLGRASGHF